MREPCPICAFPSCPSPGSEPCHWRARVTAQEEMADAIRDPVSTDGLLVTARRAVDRIRDLESQVSELEDLLASEQRRHAEALNARTPGLPECCQSLPVVTVPTVVASGVMAPVHFVCDGCCGPDAGTECFLSRGIDCAYARGRTA